VSPAFVQRQVVASITLAANQPRMLGTLSGTKDDAAQSDIVRVVFAHARLASGDAPAVKQLPKANDLHLEYSFFSLERAAARTLLLGGTDSQKYYDVLRDMVRDGKARVEHLHAANSGSGTRAMSRESMEVPMLANPPASSGKVAFQPRYAGFSADAEPTLNEAGTVVDLVFELQFVRNLGPLEVAGAAKKLPAQPLFETRKVTGDVFAPIGRQQFLGTFNRPGDTGVNNSADDGRVIVGFVRALPVQ
jgi:hypothetical protein